MKKVLFDVGANNGSRWFNELSADQENTLVYMFEPTPYLCEVIRKSYAHLKNWVLIDKAVSNYEGKSKFNVAGHYDWGCSSLLTFREDVKETWPKDRSDFNFTETIEVEVTTLNSFVKNNPSITHINYLHIDAQGSDLDVLKGSSDILHMIQMGQIEAAYNAPLYVGSPTHNECVSWLQENNFEANVVNANHECDILFKRK